MMKRRLILFKVNQEVVVTEQRHLELSEIEELRNIVACEMGCMFNEVEVDTIEAERDLSDIDSTPDGLVYYQDYCEVITGIRILIDPTSDEFIENYKNAHEYLILN